MREAELFVGVLAASSYTYAEATFTQTLPDWIGAHVRMFRFFAGVPDNLKSGVHKVSFYDPQINRSYGTMAAHYGVILKSDCICTIEKGSGEIPEPYFLVGKAKIDEDQNL